LRNRSTSSERPSRVVSAARIALSVRRGSSETVIAATFVREFPSLPRVEGIAITDDGRLFYVTDEDEGVHLRLTRLLVG
jgi:glucose/arabinose dehydrogenase